MTQIDSQQLVNEKYKGFAWQNIALVVILCIFLVELVRTAWISDDAGITLRTVINFLNGYGPRFNVDERVQGYTHPLWFLLLSGVGYIGGNVYYATFFISIFISVLTLWVVIFKIPTRLSGGIVAGLILILSKSYVDYSTSGLENPLSHLLIVILVLAASNLFADYKIKIFTFFISSGFLYLTRADLVLLIAPLVSCVLVHSLDHFKKHSGTSIKKTIQLVFRSSRY
jgi:arabinofuranosyltransferase